jgi:hypothetical protein
MNQKATRRSLSVAKRWPELAAEALADVRENVTDCRPEQRQDNNYHNRHEDEDQSVFDQTLAFFITGTIQHDKSS